MGWAFIADMFRTETDFDNLEDEVEDLASAMAIDTTLVDKDLQLDDLIGGKMSVPRLKEGVERFFITDINNAAGSAQAQSTIVVMHDAVTDEPAHFNHIPGGANILYMDGARGIFAMGEWEWAIPDE